MKGAATAPLQTITNDGKNVNSTGAKIFPINACAAPLLLSKKAFQIMLQEFTGGDFWPPFMKGRRGGFLTQALRENPPFPPFSKGGNFYII